MEAQRERGVERRLRTLLVGDGGYERVYGGEAVVADGAVVGRVRSAAYGFTVAPDARDRVSAAALAPGRPLAVEALGERVPAELAPDVLYDPANTRVRA